MGYMGVNTGPDYSEASINSAPSYVHQTLIDRENDATRGERSEIYQFFIDGSPVTFNSVDLDEAKEKSTEVIAAPFSEQLNAIKQRFGLSITQIADLYGVTRKAVYDWYEGAEPRSPIPEKTAILLGITDNNAIDYHRLKVVWDIPHSGETFLDVFKGTDFEVLREELGARLNELSHYMVKREAQEGKAGTLLGEAQLTEFERHSSFE